MSNYVKLMVDLEKDLASFYDKLSINPAFEKHKELFSWMRDHSNGHGDRIDKIDFVENESKLVDEKIVKFQNKIKDALVKNILDLEKEEELLDYLADSESLLGTAYDSIADFIEKQYMFYFKMMKEIRKIANEERQHAKIILNKKKELNLTE